MKRLLNSADNKMQWIVLPGSLPNKLSLINLSGGTLKYVDCIKSINEEVLIVLSTCMEISQSTVNTQFEIKSKIRKSSQLTRPFECSLKNSPYISIRHNKNCWVYSIQVTPDNWLYSSVCRNWLLQSTFSVRTRQGRPILVHKWLLFHIFNNLQNSNDNLIHHSTYCR